MNMLCGLDSASSYLMSGECCTVEDSFAFRNRCLAVANSALCTAYQLEECSRHVRIRRPSQVCTNQGTDGAGERIPVKTTLPDRNLDLLSITSQGRRHTELTTLPPLRLCIHASRSHSHRHIDPAKPCIHDTNATTVFGHNPTALNDQCRRSHIYSLACPLLAALAYLAMSGWCFCGIY